MHEDARKWYTPNCLRSSDHTKPSTGLVYMQARYYEPQTGRFTQFDPQPYQLTDFATGQNNRWTYCGGDPVNLTESGRVPSATEGRTRFEKR